MTLRRCLVRGAKSSLFNKQPTRLNRVFQWKYNNDLSWRKLRHELQKFNYIFTQQLPICCLSCHFCYSNAYSRVPLSEPNLQSIQSCQKNKAKMTRKSFKDGETSHEDAHVTTLQTFFVRKAISITMIFFVKMTGEIFFETCLALLVRKPPPSWLQEKLLFSVASFVRTDLQTGTFHGLLFLRTKHNCHLNSNTYRTFI